MGGRLELLSPSLAGRLAQVWFSGGALADGRAWRPLKLDQGNARLSANKPSLRQQPQIARFDEGVPSWWRSMPVAGHPFRGRCGVVAGTASARHAVAEIVEDGRGESTWP